MYGRSPAGSARIYKKGAEMAEVTNYSEMRRNFYEKYQKNIVPVVKGFDKERKVKLTFAIIASTILSIIGCFCLLGLLVAEGDGDVIEGALKGALFFFGLAWGVWYLIKKNFESKIKNKIMPIICSCFENLTWSEEFYGNGELFKESGVVRHFTREIYDDIFCGSHRDVNMEIVEAEFEVGSGKNRSTVFKGVVIKLDMNKNFTSHTVITPDSFFRNSPISGLRHTTLEDVQFEKKFDVYTNDEVDARYLITPTFMERLMGMKTAFKASKIRCAFYGQYLLVGLSTNKDLFSLCSLVTPMDDAQQYFQMYEEIVSIVKLIDHFRLDQKIGL